MLLCYLVVHRDRTVSKEELQSEIWPDTIVSEAALTRAVMKARQGLGDDATEQRWIKTIHGTGYRFTGSVTTEAMEPAVEFSAVSDNLLRRKNLFRTLAAYGAFVWLFNQGAALVWEAFEWSRWGQQALLLAGLAGFLPVAIISWFFLATKDGLKRPREVQGNAGPLVERRWLSASTMIMLAVALAISLYWNTRQPAEMAPSAAATTIAVLPFVETGANTSEDFLASGLTATLRSELGKLDTLHVLARTSSDQLRSSNANVSERALALDVAYLIEGQVQRQGDRSRIHAALVDNRSGTRIWSQQFDGDSANIFSIQDDVSEAVVTALAGAVPTLTAARDRWQTSIRTDSATRRGTENLVAYQHYLAAEAALRQRSATTLPIAQQRYQQALALDPAFTRAWSGLAQSQLTQALWGLTARASGMASARKSARTALDYDIANAAAHRVIAEISSRYEWRFPQALKSITTAIRLAPKDADIAAVHGTLLSRTGRHQEALAAVQRAWQLDPLNASVAATLTIRHARTGDVKGAKQSLAALLELRPNSPAQYWLRALIALQDKQYEAALAAIANEELLHLRLSVTAIAQDHLGQRANAEETLKALIEQDGTGSAFQIAEVYAQRRQPELALQWLDTAYQARDPGLGELLSSPAFEPIYSDRAFAQFADRLGLRTDVTTGP